VTTLTDLLTLQLDVFGLARIDFSVCTWLRQLHITGCRMYELPSSTALLTDLMELDLSRNALTSFDAIDFGRMSKLTSLKVSIDVLC
jgi:Leucine-rich repeat (LRR) protein